jgi:uncharacterized protein (DUF1800 family)
MATTTNNQEQKRPRVLAGLTPYAGTFGRHEITHLLKRAMFGAKKSDVDYFSSRTLGQTLDILLTDAPALSTFPLNNYNNATRTDPVVPAGATWVNAPEDGNMNGVRIASFKAWWLGNMVGQNRSMQEKMTLFWHNHFATETDVTSGILFYNHYLTLRNNAMGNFKTFVREITLDPNMLRYLNGYLNKKAAPDENYARELQELFTLGKGPGSQYTENDVKAAAKILTGWKVNMQRSGSPLSIDFVANDHDVTNKVFSTFYGGRTITGRPLRAGAEQELDDLLNMIFEQQEVAMYLCRRLYRFFVYYDIDSTVESEVITPLATLLRQSNYDIKPVLRTLFGSEHFFDRANQGCLIKSPIEYVIGIVREFNVEFPALPATTATDYYAKVQSLYNAWGTLRSSNSKGTAAMGQDLGDPPNVSGWAAYYQEPAFHEFWINTDTLPKRLAFVDNFFTNNGFGIGNSLKMVTNVLTYTDQFGFAAEDPNTLITSVLEQAFRMETTPRFKAQLKAILLSGQTSDYYWTDAWTAYKATPNTANENIVKPRLQAFYKTIVDMPEYQLS